ncbi:unnamed protein product [Trichogramma brassicae]|uniref:Uncharacterized protein n=1 Tax=Trichogramma brassicae TaxID=86971 RepID=A0A6H5I977_9HYME|nr:unnamed protein product [Trichogramma brassicae]
MFNAFTIATSIQRSLAVHHLLLKFIIVISSGKLSNSPAKKGGAIGIKGALLDDQTSVVHGSYTMEDFLEHWKLTKLEALFRKTPRLLESLDTFAFAYEYDDEHHRRFYSIKIDANRGIGHQQHNNETYGLGKIYRHEHNQKLEGQTWHIAQGLQTLGFGLQRCGDTLDRRADDSAGVVSMAIICIADSLGPTWCGVGRLLPPPCQRAEPLASRRTRSCER